MNTTTTLTPATRIALAKLFAASDDAPLTPGIHEVDDVVRLHVRAAIKVGNPTITTQISKVSPWILLGAALSKLNQTTLEAFVRDVVQRLDAGLPVADEDATKTAVECVLGQIRAATKIARAGSVRVQGELEFLD